jgi:hypothetical protein
VGSTLSLAPPVAGWQPSGAPWFGLAVQQAVSISWKVLEVFWEKFRKCIFSEYMASSTPTDPRVYRRPPVDWGLFNLGINLAKSAPLCMFYVYGQFLCPALRDRSHHPSLKTRDTGEMWCSGGGPDSRVGGPGSKLSRVTIVLCVLKQDTQPAYFNVWWAFSPLKYLMEWVFFCCPNHELSLRSRVHAFVWPDVSYEWSDILRTQGIIWYITCIDIVIFQITQSQFNSTITVLLLNHKFHILILTKDTEISTYIHDLVYIVSYSHPVHTCHWFSRQHGLKQNLKNHHAVFSAAFFQAGWRCHFLTPCTKSMWQRKFVNIFFKFLLVVCVLLLDPLSVASSHYLALGIGWC